MSLVKASLKVEKGKPIPCMFNPSELSMNFGADWTTGAAGKKGARGVSRAQYGGTRNATFRLSLLFDTTDTGKAVTTYTAQLVNLFDINKKLPRKQTDNTFAQRPPTVTFAWGDFEVFEAVVTSLDLSYTYFAEDGKPLRAKADLSLMEYDTKKTWPRQNPTSGTPEPHRTHRVQRGETLDRIAAQHYGSGAPWRQIAAANGIEDPLSLRPGALLAIPDITS